MSLGICLKKLHLAKVSLKWQVQYLGVEMQRFAVGRLKLWCQLCDSPRIMICY